MDFTIVKKEKYTLYILSGRLLGEIDGKTLKDSIAQSVEDGEKYFVLNMSGLEYMNSTGVGVLVTLLTKARHADGELVLLSPSPNVSSVLTMTRLNTIFKIFNAEDDALTAFV